MNMAPDLFSSALIAGYQAQAAKQTQTQTQTQSQTQEQPESQAWDEAFDRGHLRTSWRQTMNCLGRLGAAGLSQRRDQALRLVRDNGVTYNANSERGIDRPWALDVVPLVLGAEEWHAVARGVAQRARLLDAVLSDSYGPQRLLREGLIHPAAILGHPQFLRPLHGVAVAKRLVFYAADLIRGPDGRWLVTGEHAQAPAGAGYALENRIVLGRALAEAFRDCQVERVAAFFMSLRKTLRALSPHHHDNPRIVLLSPGPYAETYFEHAYLARYLGYNLVEGGDLTVRDDKVYLKNLGGLHQVDVILRRLADDFCDPLELRSDSVLGITGLAGAIRAGSVAVANALGSGLGENGALLPCGERLSRHLLGEELRLPAVPTVWNDAALLTADLDRFILRPTWTQRGAPIDTEKLTAAERAALSERIRMSPQDWIGQERIMPSTTPVWTGTALEARPLTLRVFAVADADESEGYAVLPGGLTRIGDVSKDTWVLSAGPVATVSLLQPQSAQISLKRGGADLPSRVADNLFWLGRYAERVEGLARLVREGLQQLTDGGDPAAVLTLLDQLGLKPVDDTYAGLLALIADEDCNGGLRQNLNNLRRSAFAVRDRLSNDTWRIINRLEQPVADDDSIAQLDRLLTDLAALAGMGMENTTRGPAWRFLDLGRRLERTQHGFELLRAVGSTNAVLETLLAVADSSITYRSRYLTTIQPAPVLDLLLVDGTNPRAVAFQLARLNEHLGHVPGEEDRALPTEAQRLALRLRTNVDLADPEALCRPARRAELAEFLARCCDDTTRLSEVVTSLYLSHAVPTPTIR